MNKVPPIDPTEKNTSPPVAKTLPTAATVHGDTRVDEYAWLRDRSDPDALKYLEAENMFTETVMGPSKVLEDQIYNEIMGRIKHTDLGVPYRKDGYWYYTRTEEGKQYRIHCRKKGDLQAPEEIVLDLNDLARGRSFLGLGVYDVSDDGHLLAYSLDVSGNHEYRLFMKDLRTGEMIPDDIGFVGSTVWGSDNRTLFYVREDQAKRPYRFYRHQLGRPVAEDELLYEETDPLYRIWTYRSRDRQYIFLSSASAMTNEARFFPNIAPFGPPEVFLSREHGHEYDVDHRDGEFYVRTNKGAKNFRLVTVPSDTRDPERWQELLHHRSDVKIEDFVLFRDWMVVVEQESALPRFSVFDFITREWHSISFPEPVYSASPGVNAEFQAANFRFHYQSFVTPLSVYEYDLKSRERRLLKQTEVLGGYNQEEYATERIWCKAADGTSIPVSLVYKRGLTKDGKRPLLLYGYGSYGISIPVSFSIPRLSLLDRGVIFALAHVRGGGDLGELWREGGRMMKKKNTFTDFIACAETLIERQYTSRDRLAIQGASAGGLLVGAVLNMRPDLFRVAHLAVPFVDVLNTMLDETLPLTVGEYLEWGDPRNKADYEYLKSYCPYTNLRPKDYPAILVTGSLNDSQVMYWEPAKYVAKLRTFRSGKNDLLLKTNMGAGHGGSSGRYDAFREQAFVLSFLLTRLGISR